MKTQWTTKGNRDTGSSCSCDQGLHQYLGNFGGGFEPPKTPFLVHHWDILLWSYKCVRRFIFSGWLFCWVNAINVCVDTNIIYTD